MKTKWLTFADDKFMAKAKVCIDSVRKFYPNDDVEIVSYNAQHDGETAYLKGFAEMRLRVVLNHLPAYDQIVMLGADCVLCNTLEPLLEHRMGASAVIVPHVVKPPPTSAARYQRGYANGDVVVFRGEGGIAMLKWMLSQPMSNEQNRGEYYEQTLLSVLPFIFDCVYVCREPSINYACFNFHERELTFKGGKYLVDGQPLRLAQFSGYVEKRPDLISRYFANHPNQEFVTPEICGLFKWYEFLLEQHYGQS